MSLSSFTTKVAVGALGMVVSAGGVGLVNTQSRVAVLEAQRTEDHERLARVEQKLDRLMDHEGVPAPVAPPVVAAK